MFLLAPAYKNYIWGGTRLTPEYGKRAPFANIAESWELSTHPDGLSIIGSGANAGETLLDYLDSHPEAAPGISARAFPILVKLIDPETPLSVQVHPDDAYARTHENSPGKTELWHILDAAPDAYLYIGLTRAVTKAELRKRIADGTIETVLHKVNVRPGETYYIPAGTLHAIGGGALLCEVQESSNLTYRVYDYDRRDAEGKQRALHIEQALAVASLAPTDYAPPRCGEVVCTWGAKLTTLADCPYFSMRRLEMDGAAPFAWESEQFTHFICVGGEAAARQGETCLKLHKGDGLFLPARERVWITGRTALLLVAPGA